MWRIKSIEVRNFKGFCEVFPLNVDSANMLIYGENGSGKSSLYWSVYTHYEAYAKTQEDAQKYFIPGKESLRNRFSRAADPSGITLVFENKETGNVSRTITNSAESYYCLDPDTHRFMRATAMSSDFMNYKFLSSLFDFDNSKENDVSNLLIKQVFPFLNFSARFIDINGEELPVSNAAFIWQYLQKKIPELRKNKKNAIDLRTPEYRNYTRLLDDFNRALNFELSMILSVANAKLHDIFKVEAEIVKQYSNATFNDRYSKRSRDGMLHEPQILLHARMTHPKVQNHDDILHPKSFFNEAKITSMALAIRLAILETRSPVDYACSTVFFDDVLISLDMSLRRMLIPVILDYAEKRQLFILTHDKALFNLWKDSIDRRKLEIERQNELIAEENLLLDEEHKKPLIKVPVWKMVEMYCAEKDGIPTPKCLEEKTYLQTAKEHFDNLRIPECANALRRACERELKRILPMHMQYTVPRGDKDAGGKVDLNVLIESFLKMCGEMDMPGDFGQLNNDRKLIMNPFSHDDIETPYYREELRRCIDTVEKLTQIKVLRDLIEGDDVRKTEFEITATKGEHTRKGRIKFDEVVRVWDYRDRIYCTNVKIDVLDCNVQKLKKEPKQLLLPFYRKMTHSVGIPAESRPFLGDILSKVVLPDGEVIPE